MNPLAVADTLTVAVATNFYPTLKTLTRDYNPNVNLRLVPGSSGKLFAQIKNGAPYDIFLSADRQRPETLEQEGLGVAGSRFTYVYGQLAIWHPGIHRSNVQSLLIDEKGGFVAIANPKFAPYGQAAKEILNAMGVWPFLKTRLSRGENVAQAYQFVDSGQAKIGLVAYAQLLSVSSVRTEDYTLLPTHRHQPIEQQALLINDNASTRAFVAFLKHPQTIKQLQDSGYGVPYAHK